MSSSRQISDFIFYYPQVLGNAACDNIIAHYNKDTFMRWKKSTFSNAYKNLGTSKVEMSEFWIAPQMFGYKTIQRGFETAVNDYIAEHTRIKYKNIHTLELIVMQKAGL